MKVALIQEPTAEILARLHSLEKEKGMIAALEPETGKWFLGSNVIEALRQAREEFPGGVFFFIKVGYPAAHSQRGGMKQT